MSCALAADEDPAPGPIPSWVTRVGLLTSSEPVSSSVSQRSLRPHLMGESMARSLQSLLPQLIFTKCYVNSDW